MNMHLTWVVDCRWCIAFECGRHVYPCFWLRLTAQCTFYREVCHKRLAPQDSSGIWLPGSPQLSFIIHVDTPDATTAVHCKVSASSEKMEQFGSLFAKMMIIIFHLAERRNCCWKKTINFTCFSGILDSWRGLQQKSHTRSIIISSLL